MLKLTARMKGPVRALVTRMGLGKMQTPVAVPQWEKEYESGKWGYLDNVEEIAHYMVIVGYVLYGSPRPVVLDMGCGHGRLAKLVQLAAFGQYVGIDLSSRAIEQANSLQIDRARFEVADGNDWEPSEQFDIIVYNESLYYLKSPIEALTKSIGWLNEGGLIVISMYRGSNVGKLWRQVDAAHQLERVDRTSVSNRKSAVWDVAAYRVRQPAEAA